MKKKIKLLHLTAGILAPATSLIALSCSTTKTDDNAKSKLVAYEQSDFQKRRKESGKNWIGWNNPKFVEINRQKSLNNFTYSDEAENVKAIAPFNNKAKRSNVVYQLMVYSFADGNGDGIGDFIGLKNNLSYFTNLGIDTLYLSPIFPASTYHGYDAIDYTAVAPELGGMEAFDAFLIEAHKNGIRVVLDMAFNHTSYEHPWFQSALLNDKSTYRSFYNFYTNVGGGRANREGVDDSNLRTYFKAIPQNGSQFTDYDGKTYPVRTTNKHWVAEFWSGMPDLNLFNSRLQEEIKNIHYFWAKKGVDGFRYDAFYHFFQSENRFKRTESGASTTTKLLSEWRKAAEKGYADAEKEGVTRSSNSPFMFGEWWGDPAGATDKGNSKDFWFNKQDDSMAIGSLIDATKWRYNTNVSISPQDERNVLNSLKDKNGIAREWMPHLENHDVDRWITYFRNTVSHGKVGAEPNTLSDQERSAYEYAVFSLLTRGGYPTLYMGDEILMQGGNKGEGDTNVREPWCWGDMSKQVYFSDERDGAQILPKASVGEGNTEYLISDPNGFYKLVSKLIQVRKDFPSVSEQKVENIANPEIVLDYQLRPEIYQDDFKYNETVLRDNHDGTYVLFIFNGDNKPISNVWLKKEFEVKKVLLSKNITAKLIDESNPQESPTLIQGKDGVKLAAFLIGKKEQK
ncbi:alpha-amylase family glycosyl hydrolase [Mycoplasma sp. CSL7503-lung]|uniref:alpha-amylase family glycosyl hydrolase n=1 Tax=Mycoplasma sp. CSL7503-lung TaxID=536372 RepID=UPI0021D39D87|nr:alpha-amylase family glycosyl hydrolase [Mycoplasma sp. CSL7503-lung]MCU4706557.1 alpha-amylase family glycosyl hydrolase [Mycoplasma sp. CSL7503-lung]